MRTTEDGFEAINARFCRAAIWVIALEVTGAALWILYLVTVQ
jgi:hypothetical protein